MQVTYAKLRPEYPSVERLHPLIGDAERQLARLSRPPALRVHCKPWLDAARYGFLVRYPYDGSLTVTADKGGGLSFAHGSHGLAARAGGQIVMALAGSHFSMRMGYRFRTELPWGLMTWPPPGAADDAPRVVPGLVETWWYPRPLFVVFENPAPGGQAVLRPGDPLCALVPVRCEPLEIREMSETESNRIADEDTRFKSEAAATPGLDWVSLDGAGFSRRYRVFSKRHS